MSHVFQFHIYKMFLQFVHYSKTYLTVVVFPLQFFWLAYSTVAKRLQIVFFGLPTKFQEF